ncbi:MAG: response regulator [Sphingobacteriales bacterium]|nr:response regulator [Sphingobacteriales bacterium]
MKKILLIEDNDEIRSNTAEILELSNYKIIEAPDGKAGIEKALESTPDLIICDIMMPKLDGYGVLHAIQKNELLKNTPFIFLTAKSERNDFRKGMELGADDYIVKPFTGTELLTAVDSRLKKNEWLKQGKTNGLLNDAASTNTNSGRELLHSFIDGRNTNKYKRKQIIYSEGNHPNRLYFLVKGKVKVYKSNEEGKELVTDLYGPGDFIGYIAMLEGGVYKDTAEALEESELAVIPKEDFDELLTKNPIVAKKFIQLMAVNIEEKQAQLLGMAYNSLRKKVAEAVLLLFRKYKDINSCNNIIDISRESLATIAGTATESLIRTLSDFKNEKLLDIKNGNIILLDENKLENLAN